MSATTTAASSSPELTPARIFEALNGFQRTAALRGAIELDLFTAIASGQDTVEAAARGCGGSSRAVRILCDYLTVNGFLRKSDGHYSLATDAAVFLDRRSPAYLGGITGFLHSEPLVEAFRDIAAVVRKGRTQLPGEGTVETNFAGWVDFARSMVPMMRAPAEFLGSVAARLNSHPVRVLDIAAGHGLFGISVAQSNRQAHITALDWEPVLAVARENAEAAGVASRHALLPGDALAMEYGGPYDQILVTNFLHHFNRATCVDVLGRIERALAPGGQVLTLEFIPNADRVSPSMPAEFAFTMLGTTAEGDAYTLEEYDSMFAEAGLASYEMLDVPRSSQRLIIGGRSIASGPASAGC